MNLLNRASIVIEKIINVIITAAFMIMTAAFFSSIVVRYCFNSGIPWAEELTRYLCVALVMMGSAVLARYGAHTNITVLEISLKGKARKAAALLQQILTMFFFGAGTRIGIRFAGNARHISSNMHLPMSVMYYIMSAAFALIVFQTFVYACNLIAKKEDT
jgi:TRAP-type C4-dicarboxylate transport system permease small subunit